jgi:hypothetical protein
VFYSINTWDPRKNLPFLLRAFCAAFGPQDPVSLVLKTSPLGYGDPPFYPRTDSAELARELLTRLSGGAATPAISLLPYSLNGQAIDWLHALGDCYVSFTHGEGWGLGAFDAATLGKPVLMTGWGGQRDYLGETWQGPCPGVCRQPRCGRCTGPHSGPRSAGPSPISRPPWRRCARCYASPRHCARKRPRSSSASATAFPNPRSCPPCWRPCLAEIPRHFHFVFWLRPQAQPFHLAHYLCLASCRLLHPGATLFFHHRHLPHGPWWERIAGELTLCPVTQRPAGFEPRHYSATAEGRFIVDHGLDYAHEADFIRLDALLQAGGAYVDMDTLFVTPYPEALFRHACVLGEENAVLGPRGLLEPSLCNAVILARPGDPFVRAWREAAAEAFDGRWSQHSCRLATRLWYEGVADLHVAPQRSFYAFGADPIGLQALFMERCDALEGLHSIHLWAHLWWSEQRRDFSRFHAGLLDEDYVRHADTTYARLARRFL